MNVEQLRLDLERDEGCNKFTKMIRAINFGDWQSAADEMIASRWYQQVTARARRLEAVMRGVE